VLHKSVKYEGAEPRIVSNINTHTQLVRDMFLYLQPYLPGLNRTIVMLA